MKSKVVYIDEQDRSYGLSGMAISLAVLNNEEIIMGIDMDRIPESIDFTHEFFFSGNPRCSAKMVWGDLTRNFHLSMVMTLGNLLSRRVVSQNIALTPQEEWDLHELMVTEGAETCGLEPDEIDELWDKDYSYLKKVFSHPSVQKITRQIAEELMTRRVLSRYELADLLALFH